MSAITVRRLPDDVKQRLRTRAAANGRSMEAEARAILVDALDRDRKVDLHWVEELMATGDQYPGVRIPELPDDAAPAASFPE